uniref:Uncharacterized protein n=1 Tax=Myoviridae sp. ctNQV2 TaxID=2827683 RepID=A0A8S5RZS2_9CAUD|nr:MAG TPA: hypothetical protein [Myoviridae sp. ctNQV2]
MLRKIINDALPYLVMAILLAIFYKILLLIN